MDAKKLKKLKDKFTFKSVKYSLKYEDFENWLLKKEKFFGKKGITKEDQKELLYHMLDLNPSYYNWLEKALGKDFVYDLLGEDVKSVDFWVPITVLQSLRSDDSCYEDECLLGDDYWVTNVFKNNFSHIPVEIASSEEFLDKLFEIGVNDRPGTLAFKYFSRFNPKYCFEKVKNFLLSNVTAEAIELADCILPEVLSDKLFTEEFSEQLEKNLNERLKKQIVEERNYYIENGKSLDSDNYNKLIEKLKGEQKETTRVLDNVVCKHLRNSKEVPSNILDTTSLQENLGPEFC